MAERTKELFETDIGISATGFAGPGGGNENDPVGTVYLGISTSSSTFVYRLSFKNCSRDEIRYGTAKLAAEKLILTIN
jgi:PncC family amidohydrolase